MKIEEVIYQLSLLMQQHFNDNISIKLQIWPEEKSIIFTYGKKLYDKHINNIISFNYDNSSEILKTKLLIVEQELKELVQKKYSDILN